jgi:hypothetical protein
MAWPYTALTIHVYLRIGGVLTDITPDVRTSTLNAIVITRGRPDEGVQVDAGKCQLVLNNAAGKYNRNNPNSPYYGLIDRNAELQVVVTTPSGTVSPRFVGTVSEWPPEWNVPATDLWVPITANGVFRRLSQGIGADKSALRRYIEQNSPMAYWPLTVGEEAKEAPEIILGRQPVRAIGQTGTFYQGQPNWGRGSLATWMEPVVELADGTQGTLSSRFPAQATTTWTADHFRTGSGGIDDDFSVYDTGSGSDTDPTGVWILNADRSTNVVEFSYLSSGETTSSITLLLTVTNPGIFDLSPHMMRMTTTANGGSTDWSVVIDGETVGSGTQAVAFKGASRIRYRWGAFASMLTPLSVGHFTLWQTPPDAVNTYKALQGWTGELAPRRIERICAEEGIALEVVGNLDESTRMGPQQVGTPLPLLDAAREVDGGILYESRTQLGLAYRTCRSMYNQGG